MTYTSIVLSGGALKVVTMIGCIKYLEETKELDNIINYVGTSGGSIISLFLVVGYSFSEILRFMKDVFYKESIQQFNIDQMFDIFTTYGINDGKGIIDFCNEILARKGIHTGITFIELAKMTGKNLVVCVSNLTHEKTEYFNVDTEPHLSVVKAIRMSCSIPLIFTPILYKDCYYVDGVLYKSFPISYFNDNKLKDIIGINIINKNYQKADDFMSYLSFLMYTMMDKYYSMGNDIDRNIVTIDIEDKSWISLFNMRISFTPEQFAEYISYGYNAIKRQLTI